ncbi:MAG: hypothetical protein MUF34_38280 [Polyangiaceae bacterium]|nr:hypothetical protein [Polyangiaceae bacterium]
MSNPSEITRRVLDEVAAERARQEAKWGQCDYPSVGPEFEGNRTGQACAHYGLPPEQIAKRRTDEADQRGAVTFAHVAVEELAEALSAPDEGARREELVQLAAVAVKWIEAIDRRRAAGVGVSAGPPPAPPVAVDLSRVEALLKTLPGVSADKRNGAWHVIDSATRATRLSAAGEPLRFRSIEGLIFCLAALAGMKPKDGAS